jgi:large exoprotein involved in heme utilization and adhesion
MTGGTLLASGGQINLASVASPGEVSAVDFMPASGMTMGNISLSQGALLDVSADAAGTVRIRGGQLLVDNATLSADTTNGDGALTAIDINVTGDMSLANELSPALTARTDGTGDAGTINIQSGNLEAITSSSESLIALIDTHTSGTGTAGNVAIDTGNGNLHATNFNFFIDTGSAGTGHGGAVGIVGTNILIEGPAIATGNFRFGQLLEQDVTGSAGNLSMKATESLEVTASTISTEAGHAMAGDITLNAHDILIQEGSQVALSGDFGSATIKVTADHLRVDDVSSINNVTVVDPGGEITINARIVEMATGGVIQTATIGDGPAGNINITATERFTLNDQGNVSDRPTGLLSTMTTDQMEIFGGAQINTSTRSSGDAGDISITAQSVTISGERSFETPDTVAQIGSTRASGIYTRTVGSDFCLGPCGTAGNVAITAGSLNLDSGGTINSGTTNNGDGRTITINATNIINISGTMTDGTPSGIYSRTVGQASDAGVGGNIALTADQSVTISDGASVSASSTGPGNAGNISIDAGQQFDMQSSSITTQATQASGGNIDIRAVDRVRLVNSVVSSSVQGDASTAGGNITIDPNVVVLQNSQVIAQAAQGAGGNITIFTPLFLTDSTSLVSASSQFGVNGTVTIQNPTSNLSGSLGPLASKPSQAQSLLTQRCAALVNGQASSFVVAGREQLPSDPGGWLTSPLAFAALGEDLNAGYTVASAPAIMAMAAHDTGTVSLRRLTAAGFLMANFAESEATGCHS